MNNLLMLEDPTLQQVWELYKTIRDLKPLTVIDYEKKLSLIPNLMMRPASLITKQDIIAIHTKLLHERGLATANYVIRVLAAILQFALEALDDRDGMPVVLANPARVIRAIRAADKPSSAETATAISQADLALWYAAVQRHPNASIRDWMIFMLRTGARRVEATELKHEHVGDSTVQLGRRTVPASEQLQEMLARRSLNRYLTIRVFEGRANGKISDWNKSSLRLSRDSGVKFTPYQLRLTYRAIAVSIGIPEIHINRLMRGRDEFVSSQLAASQQAISDEIDRLVLPLQLS